MEDEFTQRVIELDAATTGLHMASSGGFRLYVMNEAGQVDHVTFSREAADRLAVWLRCRLDKPEPKPTPATRKGTWDLEFTTTHWTTEDAAGWAKSQGVTRDGGMSVTLKGPKITLHQCSNVPEELPSFISARPVAPHPSTFRTDQAKPFNVGPGPGPAPARLGFWTLTMDLAQANWTAGAANYWLDEAGAISYGGSSLDTTGTVLTFKRCRNVPAVLPNWVKAEPSGDVQATTRTGTWDLWVDLSKLPEGQQTLEFAAFALRDVKPKARRVEVPGTSVVFEYCTNVPWSLPSWVVAAGQRIS
jgi:hypothetical protein